MLVVVLKNVYSILCVSLLQCMCVCVCACVTVCVCALQCACVCACVEKNSMLENTHSLSPSLYPSCLPLPTLFLSLKRVPQLSCSNMYTSLAVVSGGGTTHVGVYIFFCKGEVERGKKNKGREGGGGR